MAGLIAALISGVLFGLGLQIAGMTDPNRVLGFLDIFGAWNPSLAVMMAAAVVVTFVGYRLARPRKPRFAAASAWPSKTSLDRPLISGAVIFGAGWGLVGLCPGPALVNLATLSPHVIAFVAAMAFGMVGLDAWQTYRARNDASSAASRSVSA